MSEKRPVRGEGRSIGNTGAGAKRAAARAPILVLGPEASEPRFAELRDVWAPRLFAPLEAVGLEPQLRSWNRPGPSVEACVAPLLAWGYHRRPDAFRRMVRRLGGSARMINPPDAILRNLRKTYLAALARSGLPVAPTLFARRADPEALALARARFGDRLVVKPVIGGGSRGVTRIEPAAAPADPPAGPVMIQPFLESVADEGELSLLFFGGRFSHAVRKRPAPGEYRVQVQYGGAYAAETPSEAALDIGRRALAAFGGDLAYARIDLVRGADGALVLMELEAIEPDLYLEHAPDGGRAFAQALLDAVLA